MQLLRYQIEEAVGERDNIAVLARLEEEHRVPNELDDGIQLTRRDRVVVLAGKSAHKPLSRDVQAIVGALLAVGDERDPSSTFPDKPRVRQVAPENALGDDRGGQRLNRRVRPGPLEAVLCVEADEANVDMVDEDVIHLHWRKRILVGHEEELDFLGVDLIHRDRSAGDPLRGFSGSRMVELSLRETVASVVPSASPGRFLSCELIVCHPRWRRSARSRPAHRH